MLLRFNISEQNLVENRYQLNDEILSEKKSCSALRVKLRWS